MPALHDIVTKGSVDRSVVLHIMDSGDGTPETGVVYNTSGIDLWYRREGAAKTSITEATLAALTTAHADGGFLHISDGDYRLDLPDAAFATAANYVDFGGTVTGMIVVGGRVRLVDYSLEDSVRMGLTALPNAAAAASGGLHINGSNSGTTTFAAVTVTGSFTISDGLLVARSSSNLPGMTITGNGTGTGLTITSGSGATGNALQITSASTNGHAISLTGTGTGNGLLSTPGATGHGIRTIGGATSGTGLRIEGTAGNSAALSLAGQGSASGLLSVGGATGTGAQFTGGATSGSGVQCTGTAGNAVGLNLVGQGSASGLNTTGGATGHGIRAVGGATSGHGITALASTAGSGILATGVGTTQHGISGVGGSTSSAGINATGGGTGAGILTTGGATGVGIQATGGSTSGAGIQATGTNGNAPGMNLVGQGSGSGLVSTGGTTGNGVHSVGGATSGHGIHATGTTLGKGINATGAGAAMAGISAFGGAGSNGLIAVGNGDDTNGIAAISGSGATGNGILGVSVATNGNGMHLIKTGTGLDLQATTSGLTMSLGTGGITAATFAADVMPLFGQLAALKTAQSASTTGLVLASSDAYADDTLIGMTLMAYGSTQGYWQSRVITDNALSGDTVTVSTWAVTPSGTVTYLIVASAPGSAGGSGTLTAEEIRDAVGLASADLDAQLANIPTNSGLTIALADLPTNAELATALGTADDATLSAIAAVSTKVDTIDDFLDTEMAALITSVDALPTNAELATALAAADDAVLSAVAAVSTKVDTVDDFLDTEMAAVKLVTDHLATALELDGSVYRFTTNALEQAPTGGGGGGGLDAAGVRDAIGLATANLDTQLAGVQAQAAAALTAYDPPTRTEATSDKNEILAASGGGAGALSCTVNTAFFTGSTTVVACILTEGGDPVVLASGDLTGREFLVTSGDQNYEGRYIKSTVWDDANQELRITLSRALPAILADGVTAVIR